LLEAAPCGEQRLLEQVLGVLRRADDPVEVHLKLAPVRVGQFAECVLVAGARTVEGLLGHARILALTLAFDRIRGTDVAAARNSPLSFRRRARLIKHTTRTRSSHARDPDERCARSPPPVGLALLDGALAPRPTADGTARAPRARPSDQSRGVKRGRRMPEP